MTKEAVAERARKLTHELEGWNTIRDDDVRHKFYELIERALAVCANEALEKAAVAGNQAMLDWNCTLRSDLREWAGRFVAERIRALKAEG